MLISERPAEREREGEEHIFGVILETESHIIPCRLKIPYHPLQKHADMPVKPHCAQPCGIAAPNRNL